MIHCMVVVVVVVVVVMMMMEYLWIEGGGAATYLLPNQGSSLSTEAGSTQPTNMGRLHLH